MERGLSSVNIDEAVFPRYSAEIIQLLIVLLQLEVPVGSFGTINGSSMTDAVLGAMFIAGRSCGPPNALSSSTLAAIEAKYVESVCYYAGPIFRSITDNNTVDIPCYNTTFESDLVLVGLP